MTTPTTTTTKADDNVTIEQVQYWLGSDWSFSNICEVLQELANGDYEQEQLREDIKSTWKSAT